MRSARALSFCAAFAVAGLTAGRAHAQSSYRLSPVGGRTTLVGGTGLVYGHDSASAFGNPATVVRVDSSRLAFSVNFYDLSITSAGSWYQPGPVDQARFGDIRKDGSTAVSTVDFDSLPGSLCVFLELADMPVFSAATKKSLRDQRARLGVCLASIHYDAFSFNAEDYEQATPTGVSRQAHNIRQTFRRVSVGPSYSMNVSKTVAFGASVHFSRSSHRSLFGATATTYGGARGPITSSFYDFSRGDSHDLTASAGVTWRIAPHQSVALAVETSSLHLWGSGGLNFHSQYAGAESAASTFTAQGDFRTETPPRVALGTGVEYPWGSAELDVTYRPRTSAAYVADYAGRSFDVSADGTTSDTAKKSVLSTRALGSLDVGVGGEVFLTRRLSLLGGARASASIVPKGTLAADPLAYHVARTHEAALSFGIGSHAEGGDLLLGLEGSYGWGERLAPNVYQLPTRLEATDYDTYGLLFVFAGSTSFRSIKRAVDEVTKVFDPASDGPKKGPPPPPGGAPAR